MTKNLGFYPARRFSQGRGRWSGKADIIVCHTTAGAAGLKEYENNPTKDPAKFSGSMGWFCSPKTEAQISSHFITDREGRFLQVVRLDDMAWCNGNNAAMRMLTGVKQIIKERTDNANLYTYSIESEGSFGTTDDPPGTQAQFEAIVECIKLCIDDMHRNHVTSFYPDENHIIGHCHISPMMRVDCPAKNHAEKYPFKELIQEAIKYIKEKYPDWISFPEEGIKQGDTVSIKAGATWYGATKPINKMFTEGKTYMVDELKGTRAVLDKKGINSPIDTSYLEKVEEVAPTSKFKVGDRVSIKPYSTWWNSTSRVPLWAIGGSYTIDEIDGSKLLLDKKGIASYIDEKNVELITDEPLKIGDMVKIMNGATWWNSTSKVPSWAIGKPYIVSGISSNKVLLDKESINSNIDIKYLEKVSK